jgi:glycosyltransferase involved in cell wall biosynthesis
MTAVDGVPPSIAVCIPTYNQAAFLPHAVESALTQQYAGPLEVWVGDDASTDDTPQILDEMAARDARVRVLHQPQNVGIAENSSDVLAAPATVLVVRLDSDDLLAPGYLQRLADALGRAPQAGYAHSGVIEIDEHGRLGRVRRLVRATGYQDGDMALRAALSGYRTVGNILMFRRDALEQLGFYRGRPEFVEDYDLAVRMADAGWGNVYVDESLAYYRIWSDEAGMRARRKSLQLSGYARIFDEVFGPAWERRGWDAGELDARRSRLAAHHTAACFGSQYSRPEQRELQELLLTLSPSTAVRWRVAACRAGLAPALTAAASASGRAKLLAKAVVKRQAAT